MGTLLFYALMVDPTLLVALGAIATAQAKGTKATAKAVQQLLDYCATEPNATVQYHASDMILRIHSDASYLSEPKARSRARGYFYFGNHIDNLHNGAILIISAILKNALASAAEAELGALFVNAKEAAALRTTLQEMGHEQPATPIQVDNSTACGIVNTTIQQKRSKAIDMQFYWVQDRVKLGEFHVFWKPGNANKADYFTKHHSVKHHLANRHKFVLTPEQAVTIYSAPACVTKANAENTVLWAFH